MRLPLPRPETLTKAARVFAAFEPAFEEEGTP